MRVILLCLLLLTGNILGRETDISPAWAKIPEAEKIAMLNDPDLFPDFKLYYYGKLTVSDDERTFLLLDSLLYSVSAPLELRFELFMRIIDESDGALSEIAEFYCRHFLMKNSIYVIEQLRQINDIDSLLTESFIMLTADDISYEPEPKKSFNNLKSMIVEKILNDNRALVPFVEKIMEKMRFFISEEN